LEQMSGTVKAEVIVQKEKPKPVKGGKK